MTIDVTATLVRVEGNQEEFADIIGTTGQLYLNADNNWYCPINSDDLIEFVKKRVTRKNDRIRISTYLGNVFTFCVE